MNASNRDPYFDFTSCLDEVVLRGTLTQASRDTKFAILTQLSAVDVQCITGDDSFQSRLAAGSDFILFWYKLE